jgi:hypothetical protein
VQVLAVAVGAVFLVVGVLGFLPGVTTGDLRFAGPDSGAELFGIFRLSVLHNLVHLVFGVVGILAFATSRMARSFLILGGGVYLVLWIYGVAIEENSSANVVPMDDADNWLHLGLGAGMILLGVLATLVEWRRGEYPEKHHRPEPSERGPGM